MTSTEPIEEYFRELVTGRAGEAKEAQIYTQHKDDELAYRVAAFNLLATGAVDTAERSERFQAADRRVRAADQFYTNPIQIQEGVVECPRCNSTNTIYYEHQSRRADEATTLHCKCLECGKNWKEN